MSSPDASVIVTVGGRDDHLQRLLTSLATSDADLEVVLVDVHRTAASLAPSNGRTPSAEGPAGHHRVRTEVCPPTSAGVRLAAARNLGARAATADVLVFLDVDGLAFGDCVAQDARVARRFPRALVCGPVRHLDRGWEERWNGSGPEGLDDVSRDLRSDLSTHLRVARHEDYDRFWSLRFACTRATYDRVGGFDESYVGYGGEDTDLARRARQRSVAMVWHDGTPVYHQWHPPSRYGPAALSSIVANARRFRAAWGDWPMESWLAELAARGCVTWDPSGAHLELTGG